MDTITVLHSHMTVEDVLKTWPDTYSVFLNGKAECIGCFLQKFCTLQDVAEAYQIPVQKLTAELEIGVQTNNKPKRSTL